METRPQIQVGTVATQRQGTQNGESADTIEQPKKVRVFTRHLASWQEPVFQGF